MIYSILLINLAPVLFDCSEWYRESEARNTALQTQLDDINSKLIPQAAEILQLQDLLKKSQEASDFYRQHALQADLVPPRRRCRLVCSDADNVLTPDELINNFFGLVMIFRSAIAPSNAYKISTLNSKLPSSKCLLHLRSFSHFM